MAVELSNYQLEAVDQLKNGSILCGGVGSGKSRTALAYYYFKVCEGNMKVNGKGKYIPMRKPRDLYIITPAKKRDSLEWDKECYDFVLCKDKPELSLSGVKVTIDSWNNIKKYKNVYGAFFIFDEQRLVGSGAWVKAFYNIARKNQWILLSATPGDQWTDYIPVFVANGFYKNKTEFKIRHCVYSRYTKYPKIERYVDEKTLKKYRDDLLVNMKDNRMTIRHNELVSVDYDKMKFRQVYVDRWDLYENRPIAETGKLYYLMRKVVNSDESRIIKTAEIVNRKDRCIIFYNFSYELDLLRTMCEDLEIEYAEWNGKKHQDLPEGERWVYLVQYSAGCEGWNCITTDTIIFYSQSYSYRMTEQASGRIDRLNTPYTDLYYYHLRSSAWIDLAIYRSLKNKKNFNESSQKLKIKA
jgi:superfamily II DNA or RNA helicase